jgi:signal transduction histidine kinase
MDIAEENALLRSSKEHGPENRPRRGRASVPKRKSILRDELRIRLDERDRIARELHDSTSQLLVALELQLMRLRQLPLARDSGAFDDVMAELSATLSDLHMEVRGIVNAEAFDCHSLTNSLPLMVEAFSLRTGIAADAHVGGLASGISREIASALYRIAQEALANVTRHSRALNVRLDLSTGSDRVILRVADDGVGFPSAAAMARGRGIANMRARLDELGGRLSLRNLGRGALVEARIDLKPSGRAAPFLLSSKN